MPDPKELQKKLKNLNSAQFGQVLFYLNIDQAIIRENDAPAEKAIELIRLLKQRPDGLQELENVLTEVLGQRKQTLPPVADGINLKKLLGGVVVVTILIFIVAGFRISRDPSPPPLSTPSTSNNNSSYPCSEGYRFEGSGPGPSGEYSGRCVPTSSDTRASSYDCIVQSGPCPKP